MRIFLFILLSFFSGSSNSQDLENLHLLNTSQIDGTVQIKYKNNIQSGFLYKASDSITYIITAKHVLIEKFKKKGISDLKAKIQYFDSIPVKDDDYIEMQISYKSVWTKVQAQVKLLSDPNVDILLIKTDIKIIGKMSYHLSSTGVLLGQDCYFLGFPLGLNQSYSYFQRGANELDKNMNDHPFLRKAVISGIIKNSENNFIFIVDGHNTLGFSGGPVFFYNYSSKSFYILGVISGYLNQENKVLQKDGRILVTQENSGMMIVSDINKVVSILK